MAVTPKIPGNMVTNERGTLSALTSSIVTTFATQPDVKTAISLENNGAAAVTETTSDALKSDGTKLLDMEDANIIWQKVASSTDNYFAGPTELISGVRFTQAVAASVSAAAFSVTQIKTR